MAPRNIPSDSSIEGIWEEMVYTEARLGGDANASDLAGPMAATIAEIDELHRGQRAAWREEIRAQAVMDGLNDQLDDLVVDFADTLAFTVRDRKSPRFTRYFAKTPYNIVRLALPAEIEMVRGWPASLATEPEAALKDFAPRFSAIIGQSGGAGEARIKAAAARADHRVRAIETLIAKVNGQRNTLYATLLQRAEERKLGKYWPDAFFRVQARKEAAAPEPVPVPVPA